MNSNTRASLIVPENPDVDLAMRMAFLDLFLKIFKHEDLAKHRNHPKSLPPEREVWGSETFIYILTKRHTDEGFLQWGVHCEICDITNPLPLFIDWEYVWKQKFKPTDV